MEFLNTAFTFPTAVFSTLLLIVILFWAITLLGFADIDMFEGDIDVDVEGDSSSFKFGFSEVPITVSLSIVIMISWLVCIYAHQFFSYLLGDGIIFYLMGLAMVIASFIAALPLTAAILHPLKRFFNSKNTVTKNDLLGLECVIATSYVNEKFGQARVMYEGAEQLIEVRHENENELKAGDIVVLLEHLEGKHCYTVAAKPW